MASLLSVHTTETSALLNEASSCADASDPESPTVVALQAAGGEQSQRCAFLPRLAKGRYVSIGLSAAVFFVMIATGGILEKHAVAGELRARKWGYSQYTGVMLLLQWVQWVQGFWNLETATSYTAIRLWHLRYLAVMPGIHVHVPT